MRILAIETSCDETGISILEAKGNTIKVLANELSSQVNLHREFGGVYPALAKREHIKNLPILLEKVLKKTKLDKKEKPVDMIAVTVGPGLEPALWTGIVFAQELGKKWGVPIQPVNHMEGHILSPFGKVKGSFKITKVKQPALSLLVSGGHTELVLLKQNGKYEIIGETLDDAAGEAFDKVARMLALPYPGGPEISRLAEIERKIKQENIFKFPRPMLKNPTFDFSYSGLKTSVLYTIQKIKNLDQKTKALIALEFENAVIETLVYKTKKATEKYKVKTLIVGGGVANNKHLRRTLKKEIKNTTILFPEKDLTTDNSVMIGIAGYTNFVKNKGKVPRPNTLKAEGNLRLK